MLAMEAQTTRSSRQGALSLTSIASRLASTGVGCQAASNGYVRQKNPAKKKRPTQAANACPFDAISVAFPGKQSIQVSCRAPTAVRRVPGSRP